MNEQFSIAGKVAVITGAGGVLGGSIAKCFMEQGAKVVAVDIRQEQLDKRVEELKAYGEVMYWTLPALKNWLMTSLPNGDVSTSCSTLPVAICRVLRWLPTRTSSTWTLPAGRK